MFKGSGPSGGKTAMAAGAAVAAVLALGVWLGGKRDMSDTKTEQAIAQPSRENAGSETAMLSQDAVQGTSIGPDGTAATEPQAQKVPSEETPRPPAFDEVRRDPDGVTVIAGRAAPGSVVAVLNDGQEVASATADGSGKFATLAVIPPDGKGHVLTLLGKDGDTQTVSAEEIILAPIAAPVDMAKAEVAPAPEDRAPEDSAQKDRAPDARDANVAQDGDDVAVAALDAAPQSPDVPVPSDEDNEVPTQSAAAAPTETSAQPTDGASADPVIAPMDSDAAEADTLSDPTAQAADEATPLAGTATEAAEPETRADAQDSDQTTATQSVDATPLAGTATAEAEPDATLETPDEEQTADSSPSDATPLAGTGGVEGTQAEENATTTRETAEQPNNAPSEGADSNTLAERAPTAEPRPQREDASASKAETAPGDAEPRSESTVAPALAVADDVAPDPAALAPTPPETGIAQTSPDAAATTAPSKPPAPTTAPVAVLKSTADGVERIDTAPPQVMTNVALDTIGYSDQGAVQLAGRAQPETREVRVYLNNDAIISLPVDQEGRWRGDLPDVDEGIYTLRVDELSEGGDVTSRVETPFKRESPKTLAEASAGLTGPLGVVTVQKGDTLWAISRERYGDPFLYVKVFEANSDNIRDPNLIYPGQVFDLPETAPEE